MLEQEERRYSINEVLSKVIYDDNKARVDFDGDQITMGSSRYKLFAIKGVTCAKCGIVGEFFVKEKTPNTDYYHLTLYATKDGKRVEMTQDHIIPKSEGGLNSLDNYRPMCKACNQRRGIIKSLKFSPERVLREIDRGGVEIRFNGVTVKKDGRGWVISKRGKVLHRTNTWVRNRIPEAKQKEDIQYLSEVRFPLGHAIKLATDLSTDNGKKKPGTGFIFNSLRQFGSRMFKMGVKGGR